MAMRRPDKRDKQSNRFPRFFFIDLSCQKHNKKTAFSGITANQKLRPTHTRDYKMKKVLILGFVLTCGLCGINANAQTVKYRQTKTVDRNSGVEYAAGTNVKYITFSGNRFSFTNQNGQLDNSVGSWSYCNTKTGGGNVSYNNGYGGQIITGMQTVGINQRVFSYVGMENGAKKYVCRRPVLKSTDGSVCGYIEDVIYFSPDMSRFNVYSGGTAEENGLNCRGNVRVGNIVTSAGYGETQTMCFTNQVLVFERVDNTTNGGVLY